MRRAAALALLLLAACGDGEGPLAPYRGFWDRNGGNCTARYIHVAGQSADYRGLGRGTARKIVSLADGSLRIEGRWITASVGPATGLIEVRLLEADVAEVTRRAVQLSPVQNLEMGHMGRFRRCRLIDNPD